MSITIGEISYTNILPIYYYLNRKKLIENGCTFVPQIPSQLNQTMAEGKVDVGGISSFAYGENFDRYHILPNLSVSANNKVGSIFLFSKVPIEQLKEKKVALTSSSATSINLLKIILHYFYGTTNDYVIHQPNFQLMMENHDACLLIGDDAIVTSWKEGSKYYRYDLAELWNKFTGYPMTFAVFAIRNEVLGQHDLIEMLYKDFILSKQKSEQEQYYPMIEEIRQLFGGDKVFWNEYFSGLCYDLKDRQLEGLQYYYKLAFELGLLRKKVESISVWGALDHCHSI